jgi:hypothetical protein
LQGWFLLHSELIAKIDQQPQTWKRALATLGHFLTTVNFLLKEFQAHRTKILQ